MECYSAISKAWNSHLQQHGWTRDYHTDLSESERQRHHKISLLCEIWNRTQINSPTKQKRLTDVENRLMVAKGEGGGIRKHREFGINRCRCLDRINRCLDWINNKVLLCSTGNYIQYVLTDHNGKEYEKECVYM